ncbi:hypothetical protein evm_014185 [Chilo suppressalis]|nr:hypothetical protein evm_014185 [Chilo suppressalis]
MESEVNVEKDDFKLPWAVYNDHVKVIKIKKKENNVTSYDVKCVHCQKTLTIDDRSTSNLRKHLSSFHLSILKQIDQESKNHKGKKRKHDESNSSNFKQLSIENATGKHISQDKLDKMVLDCIVSASLPFRIVENEHFRFLIENGFKGKRLMTRPTVSKKLDSEVANIRKNLLEKLSHPRHVSSTADCWSVHKARTS